MSSEKPWVEIGLLRYLNALQFHPQLASCLSCFNSVISGWIGSVCILLASDADKIASVPPANLSILVCFHLNTAQNCCTFSKPVCFATQKLVVRRNYESSKSKSFPAMPNFACPKVDPKRTCVLRFPHVCKLMGIFRDEEYTYVATSLGNPGLGTGVGASDGSPLIPNILRRLAPLGSPKQVHQIRR